MYSVIIPFTTAKARAQPSLMSKTKGPVICEDLFMCEEESDVQVHMDTGRHIMVMECESIYDLARKKVGRKSDRSSTIALCWKSRSNTRRQRHGHFIEERTTPGLGFKEAKERPASNPECEELPA